MPYIIKCEWLKNELNKLQPLQTSINESEEVAGSTESTYKLQKKLTVNFQGKLDGIRL